MSFGVSRAGGLNLSAGIDTSDDNVTFTRAVTLGGDVDIDTTGATAGNILFSSTIDTSGYNLSLDAGTAGNITLSGALTGGGAFLVRSGAAQSYQALTVGSLQIENAVSSALFNGADRKSVV